MKDTSNIHSSPPENVILVQKSLTESLRKENLNTTITACTDITDPQPNTRTEPVMSEVTTHHRGIKQTKEKKKPKEQRKR